MKKWTIEDSKELYNINGWGTSYFGINEKGDAYVTPCKDNTQIDLRDVMDELALRDVTPPVLLRFPDILDNRIEKMSFCYDKAREAYDFKGENYSKKNNRGNFNFNWCYFGICLIVKKWWKNAKSNSEV